MSTKEEYHIGLVVPLKEEFRYVDEIAAVRNRYPFDGTFLYEMDFGGVKTIACIVGDMGQLPAMHATNRLLSFADVKIVVLIGLAGGLDNNVMLGDVVVADEVNEFLAKSKAVESIQGLRFKFSGRHTRLDYTLRETINHFDVSGGNCLEKWHKSVRTDFDALGPNIDRSLCNSPPTLHLGSIASGDVVGAAQGFTDQLLEINRKFLALDMEAAGVVKSASDRLNPVRVLVLRGISDFADERKAEFDQQEKGVWRRLSMRNATFFFLSLLGWEEFRSCIGLAMDNADEHSQLEADCILQELRMRIGGPWIVGVLFRLHGQAPVLSDKGEVTTNDIGVARISDRSVDEMMRCVERIRSAMEKRRITSNEVCKQLGDAIEAFKATLDAPSVELLKQFDEVILTIFTQTYEVESNELEETLGHVEAMIDDGRLDEAEQMLAVLDERQSRVRELLADLYFSRGQYTEVVRLLSSCEPETLSRRELEHQIASCYELSRHEVAGILLQKHAHQFRDTAGQLFQLNIRSRYRTEAYISKDKG